MRKKPPPKQRKRSRNGSPSPEEYRPGRWRAIVDLGKHPDGKRNRVYLYARSKEEIEERLLDALQQKAQGTLSGSRTPLGTWLDHWMESAVKAKRPNTYYTYRTVITRHIRPAIGHIPLGKLSPGDIRTCLDAAIRNAGPPTAAACRMILSAAIRAAEEQDLVFRNVARITRAPVVAKSEPHPYTLEQALRLVEAIIGDAYEALWLVGLTTGLRHSESLGLTWPAIDWGEGVVARPPTITVTHQLLQERGKGLQLVELKTEASAETIAMPDVLVDALRRHQERQTIIHPWRLVFIRPDGRPMSNAFSNKQWHELLDRHQLPEIRYHDLRHTCGSLLHAAGIDLKVIQATLRHANYQTTANRYVHTDRATQQRAANTMDDLFRKRPSSR